MDANALLEAVAADNETALSRLASSKVLYALTGGELDDDAVFAAMASRATAAADRFDAWVADEPDADVVETMTAASAALRANAEAIEEAAGGATADVDIPDLTPFFDYLAALSGPVERAAGLAAWALVEDGVRSQAVGFFVGRADPASADRFRELRGTVASIQDDAAGLLDDTCESEADWEDAVTAADATVDAAYQHYVAVLEDMGITVKPVC